MEAHVTAASQQYRLREQVEKSRIQHGETVRADISRVRVASGVGFGGEATIFFCEMEPIKVRRRVAPGDSAPLPETVVLEGIGFPEAGEYDLKDAIIHSNGDIRIIADSQTRVVNRADGLHARIGRILSAAIW
jgi:hypothetical protein